MMKASSYLLSFMEERTMPSAADSSSPSPSPDDTRQRILQAAAQTFAEKGYARATTRIIAAAAEVNEVTLFRHFGNKKNLFTAVIQQYSALNQLENAAAQFTGHYRQDLHRLGQLLYKAITERQDAMRLMLCEASEMPEVRDVMVAIPQQLRRLTANYLAQQMAAGRIREGNPQLMAQSFLGMFFSHSVAHEILGDPTLPETADEVIAQFVDIFVQGTELEISD
jgi:AcrR family transcriptional regulator